ncbi:penicillin acylase family protein [Actinopolymorpha sp. B9G3]|uniref:penicillin acylase family protein n=1 Tax=Actinopolymorpha sp. B9G3 TaxID=3158970 RepID=UPI0032D91F0F
MTQTIQVPGLVQPAEILIDEWGIPHLYAESADDAFFVQGFNAARDRLFQIDLWRRRGLGLLAEAFGPDYVERDRAARLFLYRGDMAREWAAYGPDAERIARRFTAGINAYIGYVEENPDAMPPEFAMLGHRPDRWRPEDVVRIRSHGIAHNLLQEVARSDTGSSLGIAADVVRQHLKPRCQPHLAEGLDLHLPDDLLRVFELATQPLVFAGDPRDPLGEGTLGEYAPDSRSAGRGHHASGEGSNNWVVAGTRTTTGRPILASDPHRSYATPSLRYIAHVSAPGLDVIGAGEPALPGVTLGHNGKVAFGFTIFPIDTQDLYVYELDPADPTRYRYAGDWERLRIVRETLAVKGESPCQADLAFTRHGPVIYVDAEQRKAYAVRSTWFEPGTAAYVGSLACLRAADAEEFRAALAGWGSPGENHVYADVAGSIGWTAAGLVPRRRGWDGLLPVPGDGRYEWDGFLPAEDLPQIVDPPEGFVATANQFNLSDDQPADRVPSYEWPDPARHQRIVEVLASQPAHALSDSMQLQVDQLSIAAREVTDLLDKIRVDDDPQVTAAVRLLRDWDAVESADSAAAALYEVWVSRHLMPGFVRAVLPPGAQDVVDDVDPHGLREALRDPARWWGAWGAEATERRDLLLTSTLRDAYAELVQLLGPDPSRWAWGDLHVNRQRHPLGHLDPSLDVGPMPVGGSGTTVNAGPYYSPDLVQTIGASFRMVLDVGAWDNSMAINTPGQSGDPRSPHYRDLAETWRRGDYVPLLYSRAAIEARTSVRLHLQPAADPP